MRRFSFWYFVGIVYGSLIPFHFRSLNFSDAFERFSQTPFLHLGVQSRADWVANGVLYLPLGLMLLAGFWDEKASTRQKVLLASICFCVCSGIAVTLEFLQVFTTNRTVSQNDLWAEVLGALVGILFWWGWGARGEKLWVASRMGGARAIDAALIFYSLFFFGYCLFPFDFLLSSQELTWKLNTGQFGVFKAADWGGFRGVFLLGVETLSLVPLGLLLARKAGRPVSTFLLLGYGGLLGIFLEGVQFFLASGTTQGISVAAKAFGFGFGGTLPRFLDTRRIAAIRPYAPMTVKISVIPYVWLALYLRGWLSQPWLDLHQAWARINLNMLLPFYYHYFSPETIALSSLVANAALYGAVGIGAGVIHACTDRISCRKWTVPVMTAAFAFCLEVGRLFLADRSADFTNVLIAWCSAWLFHRLTEHLFSGQGLVTSPPARDGA